MQNKLSRNVVVILVLGIVVIGIVMYGSPTKKEIAVTDRPDVQNSTYTVEGETFKMNDGVAEKSYSGNVATKNSLRVFGNTAYGDLDADGDTDAAVLLQNDRGGTGSFFYAVLVMNDNGVAKATNAMFLGDRIAPQTIEIHDGRAVYNFAERKVNEPMTTPPSIGKSVWVNYDKATNEIGEWVKDFEGESANTLTEESAKKIAESSCIKGGEALGAGSHNKMTQTWWFDANLNATKEGCNPACVVNEVTKTAEINWRCTGLVVPKK